MRKLIPTHHQSDEAEPISLMTLALQNLLRLQTIEFDEAPGRNAKSQAAELRSRIPVSMLDRYDRLRERDKKAIAIVLNSACTACHMRQPIGKMAALMRGEELQACDSCGRYLLLSAPLQAPGTEAMPSAVTAHYGMRPGRTPR